VIAVDGEKAAELFETLSSESARTVLAHLRERPSTPEELAERTDAPVERLREQLAALAEAGVVEVTTTVEADDGETEVYATTGAVVHYGDPSPLDRIPGTAYLLGATVLAAVGVALAVGGIGGWPLLVPYLVGGVAVLVGWALAGSVPGLLRRD